MHVYAWIWIYMLSFLCVQLTAWGKHHRHLFTWIRAPVYSADGLTESSQCSPSVLAAVSCGHSRAENFLRRVWHYPHWKGNWDFRLSELMLPYFGQSNSSHDHPVSVDMKKHCWVEVKSGGYICLDTHFSDSLQVPYNLHPNYTYHYAEQTDSF